MDEKLFLFNVCNLCLSLLITYSQDKMSLYLVLGNSIMLSYIFFNFKQFWLTFIFIVKASTLPFTQLIYRKKKNITVSRKHILVIRSLNWHCSNIDSKPFCTSSLKDHFHKTLTHWLMVNLNQNPCIPSWFSYSTFYYINF